MDCERHVAELREQLTESRRLAQEAYAVAERHENDALRVEQAIAALLGQKLPRVRASARGKGATRRRGITVADVVAGIRSVATSTPQPLASIRTAVEARLKEQGRAIQGFALRWKQSLSRPEFEVTADTIRVVGTQKRDREA